VSYGPNSGSKLDRSHRVMMATDKIDPWLNIFGEHGGIYSVTTEDDDSWVFFRFGPLDSRFSDPGPPFFFFLPLWAPF